MSTYSKPDIVVTLLFVSPRTDDRNSLRNILAHSNWKLHEVCGCKEALDLLEEHHLPVVICDRELPDGDWKSLLEQVAELPSAPVLIVCSRHADDKLWAEVLNLGGYDLLPTPFEASEVFRVAFLAWQSWKYSRELVERKAPGRAGQALALPKSVAASG
jgi:DNA-binding NtrC family response regulator